jgi:F-type H+-transporting ATPase subunit b
VNGLLLLALEGSAIQLVPDGTLLFHLAIIVVMVGVLNVTLLKPINRILEERDKRTEGRFSEVRAVLASISKKLQEYERRMREARAAGYVLLEQERAVVSRERERRLNAVKGELAHWQREQKERLRLETEEIKARLERDAQGMALEIGRQILRRDVAHLPTNKS